MIGIILMTIATLMTGVESQKSEHITTAFVLSGQAIFGVGFSMITIPVMPEILEGIENERHLCQNMDEQALYNNLSGYFVVCQALGESVGPTISALLEIRFDFRPTQFILMYIVIFFLTFYCIFCDATKFFSRPKIQVQDEKETLLTTIN